MHYHWRDCQEWKHEGLLLSTSSNETAKLYDAAITQYVGWYDDHSFGGLDGTLEKLIESDQDFVMGHVVNNAIQLIGTGKTARLDDELRDSLDRCYKMADSTGRSLCKREQQHVKALKFLADGEMRDACFTWEKILVRTPTDMLAVKFAHDCYFYLGLQRDLRDSIARILPDWTERKLPLYGYLMGMYSFGLCETLRFEDAEKFAKKGLELNRKDCWSTHSLAHVYEMNGTPNDGIVFLESTADDWRSGNMLACHLYWHNALYHIENGQHEVALSVFDEQIGNSSKQTGAMLDVVDATSLLYRLTMEGVDVGDRWKELYRTCLPHKNDHILAFNDIHFLMAFLGANEKTATSQLLDSIREYVGSGNGTNQKVTKEVGLSLCEAMVAYDNGDYARTVDVMLPLKCDVVKIGGSDAQRDLFSQLLIQAAMKSSSSEHSQLARRLLFERKSLKQTSSLTDRLLQRALIACA